MNSIIIFMLALLQQPQNTLCDGRADSWRLDLGFKWWEIISSDFLIMSSDQTEGRRYW